MLIIKIVYCYSDDDVVVADDPCHSSSQLRCWWL